jgi:serine phosphatase RsbU (regulator of sigma subunit)
LLYLDNDSGYEDISVEIAPGESLTLFSDGIADVQVMRGDQNEVEVLADVLLAEGGDAGRSAQLVMGFGSPIPQDDQTVVVLRRSS